MFIHGEKKMLWHCQGGDVLSEMRRNMLLSHSSSKCSHHFTSTQTPPPKMRSSKPSFCPLQKVSSKGIPMMAYRGKTKCLQIRLTMVNYSPSNSLFCLNRRGQSSASLGAREEGASKFWPRPHHSDYTHTPALGSQPCN